MFRGPLRTAGVLTALLVGLAIPAVTALADPPPATPSTPTDTTTVSGTTTATTAPTPAPNPQPKPAVAGRVRIYLPDMFFIHGDPLTVPGRSFHVGGRVTPYVAGQWVTVKLMDGRRVLKSLKLRVKPSRNHRFGEFRYHISSPRTGILTVVVVHAATPQMRAFRARRFFKSLSTNAGFGATGRFVQLIQERLAALHIYVPRTGVYDQGTGLAVDAYHRLLHWGTSQNLDGRTVSFLLDGFGQFHVRFPNHGRHAEGNLGLQLLALADGGKVDMIFPISSGKPSTPTILGDFQVYDRVPGYLPDGMYYSDFFYNGYAIHGYDPAPDYPASHGCMRLPIVDAITVFNWLNYGDWVDTYY
jgi:hypothetical protein